MEPKRRVLGGGGKKNKKKREREKKFLHGERVPKVLMHRAEVKDERIKATSVPQASVENKAGIV